MWQQTPSGFAWLTPWGSDTIEAENSRLPRWSLPRTMTAREVQRGGCGGDSIQSDCRGDRRRPGHRQGLGAGSGGSGRQRRRRRHQRRWRAADGRGRNARRGRRAWRSRPTSASVADIDRMVTRDRRRVRPDRHPRQQRRRHAARLHHGSHRGRLGPHPSRQRQGRVLLPAARGARDDPAPQRAHHQHRLDRRQGLRRHVERHLRGQQGRRDQPDQDGGAAAGHGTTSTSTPSARASCAPRCPSDNLA